MSNRTNRRPPRTEDIRHILTIAVLALFVAICVGWLCATETPLFRDLVPVVSGLLLVVVRFYFKGSEQG